MVTLVDRRNNANKDKTSGSRKRFIDRADGAIREAVKDALNKGSIKDFSNTKVKVPVRGMGEPTFRKDRNTGNHDIVVNGNRDHIKGDTFSKPSSGAASGSKGGQGISEDDFVFVLSKEELQEFFFEDLALPYFVRKEMAVIKETQFKRAGFSVDGPTQNLSLSRSMIHAMGRRIAMKRLSAGAIELLEDEAAEATEERALEINSLLEEAKQKQKQFPWLDPVDLRYRMLVKEDKPITQALMICIMDVSASMSEREKNIAKRFFIFLKWFLETKYDGFEMVLIRHHSTAEECNEHDFFYKTESGGTSVSTSLVLANKIIAERYPKSAWNIYVAHASDGDNWESDNALCKEELPMLLGSSQYYAYLDIPNGYNKAYNVESMLGKMFESQKESYPHLATSVANDETDVWAVFQNLFRKTGE